MTMTPSNLTLNLFSFGQDATCYKIMLDILNVNHFCVALAINTFFRKSFKVAENAGFLAIWLFLVGTTSDSDTVKFIAYTLTASIVAVIASKGTQEYQKFWMENTDRQDLINFVVTYYFVRQACGLSSQLPDEDLISNNWKWVPIMSLLQITRNPIQLKNFLRPLRVACGPTSICAAVLMGYLQVL